MPLLYTGCPRTRQTVSSLIVGPCLTCQKISGRQPMLFRQCILVLDVEMTTDARSAGIGLASPYADRVISFGNDWIAVFRHHAKVARLQIKMHLLASTRFELDTLESTQS